MLKLKLKKQNNKLTIRYNTFEKATFDQYLISSIIKHTKTENSAFKYIDQLTGKGSLNGHFKTLFKKINELEKGSIEKILNDSMYPILKIDASNRFTYYPELDISVFKNKVHYGNLAEDALFPKTLVTKGEFHDSSIEMGKIEVKSDSYNVIFKDDKIKLKLSREIEIFITEALFLDIVDLQLKSLKGYEGTIHTDVEGKDWNMVSTVKLNDLLNEDSRNFYHNGNHYFITNRYVKKTRVAKVFNMFMYKESYIKYEKRNRKECLFVTKHLLESGLIETMKINDLLSILINLNPDESQVYFDYLMERKDSKEITEVAFKILAKGVNQNWSKGAIESFKKYMNNDRELVLTYKLSNNDFDINSLFRIFRTNKKVLSDKDLNTVNEYLDDKKSKIDTINSIIGEITNSGRREKTKVLKNNPDVVKYRSLSNKLQGHVKKNINAYTLEELNRYYEDVLLYQKLDGIMIKLLKELTLEKNKK